MDSDGGKTFYDVTIAWDARIHAAQELADPGRAERRAGDRNKGEYNPAYAGAGAKVGTLCANPYGDFLGASRDALREVARRRASELSVASQTSEIKPYNTMISGLRTRLSLAFWRPTAVARICSRLPRSEWYARGLAKPVGHGAAAGVASDNFGHWTGGLKRFAPGDSLGWRREPQASTSPHGGRLIGNRGSGSARKGPGVWGFSSSLVGEGGRRTEGRRDGWTEGPRDGWTGRR